MNQFKRNIPTARIHFQDRSMLYDGPYAPTVRISPYQAIFEAFEDLDYFARQVLGRKRGDESGALDAHEIMVQELQAYGVFSDRQCDDFLMLWAIVRNGAMDWEPAHTALLAPGFCRLAGGLVERMRSLKL